MHVINPINPTLNPLRKPSIAQKTRLPRWMLETPRPTEGIQSFLDRILIAVPIARGELTYVLVWENLLHEKEVEDARAWKEEQDYEATL